MDSSNPISIYRLPNMGKVMERRRMQMIVNEIKYAFVLIYNSLFFMKEGG